MVTDNFDGVFVSTNCTVATETPEFAGYDRFVSCCWNFCRKWERLVCNVVFDTYGEVVHWIFKSKVVEYCKDASRCCIFGTQTVTAANNFSAFHFAVESQSCNNVEVERFAKSAWFFCSIENSNFLSCCWDSFDQVFSGEWTIKSYFYETNFFACCEHVVDNFFSCVNYRTHSDDYSFSIWCTVVVEQFVVCAKFSINFVHVFFYYCWECFIVWVCCFFSLEEDIAVLCCTAQNWSFRVQGCAAESFNCFPVNHVSQVFVFPNFDFLDFV